MSVIPKFEYDSGGGPVTITLTGGLATDDHPILEGKFKDTFGGTGIRQRVEQYQQDIITIHTQFEAESIVDLIDTMMKTWVFKGNSFKFFPDKDLGGFEDVEFVDRSWKPKRMENTRDLWEVKFKVRKKIT